MDTERQHKPLNVCYELQALVIVQLLRLIDLTNNVCQNIPHILIVHQLDDVPLLIDRDGYRVKNAPYFVNKQVLIFLNLLVLRALYNVKPTQVRATSTERAWVRHSSGVRPFMARMANSSMGTGGPYLRCGLHILSHDVVIIDYKFFWHLSPSLFRFVLSKHHLTLRLTLHSKRPCRLRLDYRFGLLVIILHEPFLIDHQVRALVMIYEDLDVCLTVDHVCCLRQILPSIMHSLAHGVNYLGKFDQIVLHKANLLVIILLHLIQHCLVFCANLIHLQIDLLYLLRIYFFGSISSKLLLSHLLVQFAHYVGVELYFTDLPLALMECVHLIIVVFLREKHLCPLFVQSGPYLLTIL